jgi:hypothetical protein
VPNVGRKSFCQVPSLTMETALWAVLFHGSLLNERTRTVSATVPTVSQKCRPVTSLHADCIIQDKTRDVCRSWALLYYLSICMSVQHSPSRDSNDLSHTVEIFRLSWTGKFITVFTKSLHWSLSSEHCTSPLLLLFKIHFYTWWVTIISSFEETVTLKWTKLHIYIYDTSHIILEQASRFFS